MEHGVCEGRQASKQGTEHYFYFACGDDGKFAGLEGIVCVQTLTYSLPIFHIQLLTIACTSAELGICACAWSHTLSRHHLTRGGKRICSSLDFLTCLSAFPCSAPLLPVRHPWLFVPRTNRIYEIFESPQTI